MGKIKSLKTRGITVFMTTHFMEEVEYLCDRVAIVRQGEIAALDSLSNLIEKAGVPDIISFECDKELNPNTIGGWEETTDCKKTETITLLRATLSLSCQGCTVSRKRTVR